MDWETLNGITGVISAIGALGSLAYLFTHSPQEQAPEGQHSVLSMHKLMSFLLACSGWVLCCLSFLWVFEPYGLLISDRDYQHFFGIMLSFPAFLILLYGLTVMRD
ncbi:MAG: hypothetical protein H6926_00175 [Chromatiales bacterium]|nr:hypothetical protein [Chromatiales bacterium]